MAQEILINSRFYETRVALIKDGQFWEYYQEKRENRTIVGNIYKAKVIRVLPGLQSAFIDIGMEKAAFLHINDLLEQKLNDADKEKGKKESQSNACITEMLSAGEEILVQVTKDPISTKGPRITTRISIPGRYLVFFPIGNKVGVSKRIESDEERKRLKQIIEKHRPTDTTFIVRTAAETASEEVLQHDMELCIRLWIDIVKRHKEKKAPFPLYEDLSLPLKVTRDLLNEEVSSLWIDEKETYYHILHFVKHFMPAYKNKVKLFQEKRPLFERHQLNQKIKNLYKGSVSLKSGGNIIIEQVEAMTVVDVNTGSFVGNNLDHSDMILQTNKEAMDRVAEQIRLRNIGGMVIIDCIDMKSTADQEKLIRYAEEITAKDRSKVTIHGITSLGLLQLTRKRNADSLKRLTSVTCAVCHGQGWIKSPEAICHEIYRQIFNYDRNLVNDGKIILTLHPEVLQILQSDPIESGYLKRLEEELMFITELISHPFQDQTQFKLVVTCR